jgi:D-aminoacyl-tRNA deacylase
LVERFVQFLKAAGVQRVETGRFGARMLVEIHNDGPVTILLDRDPPG